MSTVMLPHRLRWLRIWSDIRISSGKPDSLCFPLICDVQRDEKYAKHVTEKDSEAADTLVSVTSEVTPVLLSVVLHNATLFYV